MLSKYSIAVLPFDNMSPDRENEYFSDGITEEIINTLSKLNGFHVIARKSSFAFKNKSLDVREIGQKLNVSFILGGSIRKAENIVRIAAQLSNTENGYQLWSESWDRELKDVFRVQDEIAALIAENVNKNIDPNDATAKPEVKNTDALEYYLKGMYLQNTWDYAEKDNVIHCYEQAINLEPEMINAYIALSDTYTWLSSTEMVGSQEAFIKTQWCVEKVLKLDDQNPDIHRIISGKAFWIEWDLRLALKHINIALEGKPSFPEALMQKGLILAATGYIEEALECMFQALRLNPLSDTINYTTGFIYYLTGEDEKAIEFIDKNIQLNPGWDAQYFTKFMALIRLKKYDEAWITISHFKKNSGDLLNQLKGFYFVSVGDTEKAQEYIKLYEPGYHPNDHDKTSGMNAMFLAQVYLLKGNTDKALKFLEQALHQKSAPLLFIKTDSFWELLRGHPSIKEALKIIRYPGPDLTSTLKHKKYKKTSISVDQANSIKNSLENLMGQQMAFLDPCLTLSDLAELIDVSTNQLSQVLNEFIGQNFYDYLNAFRLKHFLKIYQSPTYKNFSILGLAYECGFKSKSTFNSFFKKILNTTPRAYLKSNTRD